MFKEHSPDLRRQLAEEQGVNMHRFEKRLRAKTALTVPDVSEGQYLSDHEQAVMLWHAIVTKHRQRGLECTLTFEDVLEMVSTISTCPVTGIPFDTRKGANFPFRRSLDRIDNEVGYTSENVRVVLKIVNTAMWSWGEQPFDQMCLGRAKVLNRGD